MLLLPVSFNPDPDAPVLPPLPGAAGGVALEGSFNPGAPAPVALEDTEPPSVIKSALSVARD
jgi:hypothetical protein